MHNKDWTLAEYAILCRHYESDGAAHTAALLGRTPGAVTGRAGMLLRMQSFHTHRKPAGIHANIEADRLARERNTARIAGCPLERWEASRKRRVHNLTGRRFISECECACHKLAV